MTCVHMSLEASIPDPGVLCKLERFCRSVTGVAGTGAGRHHIYSVGTDAMACTIDASTGKVQQRVEAGKHSLTCVKAASGQHSCQLQLLPVCLPKMHAAQVVMLSSCARPSTSTLMPAYVCSITACAMQMGKACCLAVQAWLYGMLLPSSASISILAMW